MIVRDKKCARCLVVKSSDGFGKDSNRPSGLKSYCKLCRKTEANPVSDRDRKRKWYERNRDKAIRSARARVLADPAKHQAYCAEYYKANAADIKAAVVRWQKSHRHICAWRTILGTTLRAFGRKKYARTGVMLGYTAEVLRCHIESLWAPGMSWDNHGKWHIDHIRPLSSFPSDADVQVVNALQNLQPLWATTRVIDGVTYEGNLNKSGRWLG